MSNMQPVSPQHRPCPFQSYAALTREQPFAVAKNTAGFWQDSSPQPITQGKWSSRSLLSVKV